MSRTYKDRPYKIRHPRVDDLDVIKLVEWYVPNKLWDSREPFWYTRIKYTKRAGVHTKKPKHIDTEDHWQSTPSWWTRLVMNKPQRRKGRVWERCVLLEDFDLVDPPGVSKKPHQYYW